jgi:tRNA(Ile)-lysidine synthase
MSHSSSSVRDSLRASMTADLSLRRWCVAFSGGLDSTVMLHALERLARELGDIELRAVHVDHGLHPESGAWSDHCRRFAAALAVPFETRSVSVSRESGQGIEAAARAARYAELESMIDDGEALLTAHHADDQVETLLLRLMRGTGIRGLASIAERSPFGRGSLLRPLLAVRRCDLDRYAREFDLGWIDDPTNRDTSIDRNYLRHEVIPLLRERWPGVDAAIGRTARLAAESSALLDEAALRDHDDCVRDGSIVLEQLRALNPPRQRNLVRYALFERGLLPPGEARLIAGLEQLLTARADRQPLLDWSGGQIRRYRDRLHVLDFDPDRATVEQPEEYRWDGLRPLDLGPVRGCLAIDRDARAAIGPVDMSVRFRVGGERILGADRAHHERLKKLFQARGVFPWMRAHVPLVFIDGELVAVGDLWSSAELACRLGPASQLRWDGHAAVV